MCNNCQSNYSGRQGCCGCPLSNLWNMVNANSLCDCASGVMAELVSSCDNFCRCNDCHRHSCGCRKRRDCDD